MSSRIEISISRVEQLFNGFDPAPFRERELDPKAERYILANSEKIPAGEQIELMMYLPADKVDQIDAAQLERTIQYHFELQAKDKADTLKKMLRQGRKGLFFGFLVFLVCTLIGLALMNAFPNSRFIGTLEQSLVVFAWVLIWRPVEILTYDRWPLVSEYKQLQHLTQVRVTLKAQAH
ncbi:MAG: hypothetical protein ACRC6G_02880 [Deefgea sp.]